LGDFLGGLRMTLGFGLCAPALGVGIRDLDLGVVLTPRRFGIRSGNTNPFVPLGGGRADLTVPVRLGDLDFRRGDGCGCRFLTCTFTLIRRRPTFFSSTSTPWEMFAISLSRSELISSISIVAMTTRIWPKMISFASSLICGIVRPRRRSAAFSITPGSVEIPTVKVEGVFTRMFCFESAPSRRMSIGSGVSERYW
jgi:hypothetical protein